MLLNLETKKRILLNMLLSQLGFASISITAILSDYKLVAVVTVNVIFAAIMAYISYYSMTRIVGGIDRIKTYVDDLMAFAFFRTNRIKKAEYMKNDDIGIILKELNSDDKKIITVEDPIEYKIDSINQVPINNKVGLSFELVLKNILRQDPDIIFIGEIRDKFSLDIALQASLTGHLVLASIHASSSVETITRLIDLKADPFLISTTLKAVMAQRLVLAHCKSCENGCKKCNFTKFYDRTSIAEILKIDEQISSLIFNKASFNELKEYLKNINFKTILDDGKQKVKDGLTTLEEVYKVVNF